MIDKLEIFIALAKAKHFGHAAEECRVTQPTLSAAIKQLEDQLGIMLVQRGSRLQRLTPESMRVLDWARHIVGDARAMHDEMRAARHWLAGHVRIAAIPTALSMVHELTAPFAHRYPEMTFSVLSRSSIEILSLVINLETDVGITYLDNEPLGRVVSVPLYEEWYCFVTVRPDIFKARNSVSWHEVSDQPLCFLTADMQNRRIINQRLARAGVTAAPTLESDSVIALHSHVCTGKWSSIMPLKLVKTFAETPGLRALSLCEPETAHTVDLVANYRKPPTRRSSPPCFSRRGSFPNSPTTTRNLVRLRLPLD